MPQPPRPDPPRDVVVSLERRRTPDDGLYTREVLELLRICGAPLRAGDAAVATGIARAHGADDGGDAPL